MQSPLHFGTKSSSTKRKRQCLKCSERSAMTNAINNPKTSVAKMEKKIAYEQKALGDTIDLSPAALRAAGQQ